MCSLSWREPKLAQRPLTVNIDVLGPFKVHKRPLTIGLAASQKEGTDGKSGPLIWWKLDEDQGATVANAAVEKNVGKVSGDIHWAPGQGQTGGALEFDGLQNMVEATDSESMDFRNGVTLAAWFKVRKFTENGDSLIAKGESWRLQHQGKKGILEFFMQGPKRKKGGTSSYVNVATKSEVDDGQWHFVVVTYDGARLVMYLDGAEQNSVDATGGIAPNNLPVTLGENYALPGRYFNGWLDDVRVYSRGLASEEVKALMPKKPEA